GVRVIVGESVGVTLKVGVGVRVIGGESVGVTLKVGVGVSVIVGVGVSVIEGEGVRGMVGGGVGVGGGMIEKSAAAGKNSTEAQCRVQLSVRVCPGEAAL